MKIQSNGISNGKYLRSQLGLLQYSLISAGPLQASTASATPFQEQILDRDRVPWPQETEQGVHSVQQLHEAGQASRLQARCDVDAPWQSEAFPSQVRVRTWWPPPHCRLHCDQSDQSDQAPPSIIPASGTAFQSPINVNEIIYRSNQYRWRLPVR